MVMEVIVAVVIAGVLVWWFFFRWTAPQKRWCVLFYLTSNTPASATPVHTPDAETGVPGAAPGAATLDQKLDQVVNVIRSLPCATEAGIAADHDWDDVYVVYRAIWDDPYRKPEARVVRPESSAPTAKYFPGETVFDVEYAIDFTKDITLFFEWAYDNCPAQQYAVFFWGHAMGPAGFFQPGQKPKVVSPLVALLMKVVFFLTGARWTGTRSVEALSDGIATIVQNRLRDNPNPEIEQNSSAAAPPAGATGSAGAAQTGVFAVGQVVPKVDVVLFQDCWMATLETAFELQDDARYIVASQSLVPAGFAPGQALGAVWPYENLISIFLKQQNFAAPMMKELKDFFCGVGLSSGMPPDFNRYPAKKVLFSLMDCGTTAGFISAAMKTEWQALVQSLYPLGADGRSILIERQMQQPEQAGRLFEMSGTSLQVGDQALIDVLTFCAYLRAPNTWPAALVVSQADQTAIGAAAAALQAKVATVITTTFQVPQPVAGDFVYTGAATLYKPYVIGGDDPYIMGAFRSSYDCLRFATETDATPPPPPGTSNRSWTQYAFDRYDWI
jgi:hypothetical protein